MPKLAIKGGTPVAPGGLRIKWPEFDDEEREALLRVLESGHWWRGEREDSEVTKFEDEWANFIGTKHAVAVSSGTAALIVALRAAGIEAGDEVLVPTTTFVATATAVVLSNAVPIFVDMLPDTYQMDPDAAEASITEKTRAIIVVHYAGYPCDMDRFVKIAEKHNLVLIEDCAHAHGTEWRGKKVGSFGHFGCFSFQMSKVLTSGEGGAVNTDDDELSAMAFSQQHIGRLPGRPFYEFHLPAHNFRMTEWQGAILRAQLRKLPRQIEIRHETGEYLASELKKIGGVDPLPRDPRITKRSYYFFVIRYNKEEFGGVHRDKFLEALRAEGIPCGAGYGVPVHKNPLFQSMRFGRRGCPVKCPLYGREVDYSKVSLPVAERAHAEEQVTLPTHLLLGGREYADKVIEAIAKIKENVDELRS